MTDLADRIEAGAATDAEVATALGYSRYDDLQDRTWWAPPGCSLGSEKIPPFTTCITTLAKECERRGWWWEKMDNTFYVHTDRNSFTGVGNGETLVSDCPAFAAALIRAVEGETK